MYMPVSCLNTFTQDWVIKVKITKKYDLKQWKNAKGSGTLLNLDLIDLQGTQVQATMYNDAANKWAQLLNEGSIYTMSNGQVKLANKRFTTIPHDHCITFDVQADIQEVHDLRQQANFQGSAYSFKTLKEVQDAK